MYKVKKNCDNAMVCFDSFSKFLQFWLNLSARTQQIYSNFFFFLILWHPWGRVHIDLNKNSARTGCVISLYQLIPQSQLAKNRYWVTSDILWRNCNMMDIPQELVSDQIRKPYIPICIKKDAVTDYSFWDWLRNFLQKFTWVVLSVHKLNKLGKWTIAEYHVK